jgi:predicted helicase
VKSSDKPKKPKNPLPRLLEQYYSELKELRRQNVMYELGTRTAFHNLLAGAGRPHGWTLIPELERKALNKGAGGSSRTIRPDGTFKDAMNLVRGYWEAKDPGDDLTVEIQKKRKAGYPFNNIIFEDNQTAVLFQHDREVLRADMTIAAALEELILEFFRYVEPEIQEFEHAVEEFKERVPDLAAGLAKKIADAHRSNPSFRKAFGDFFELCKHSLNPNMLQAAVDEMLVQHILTERLIREIFDNPEFVRRNVIAVEVEKVMQAMTSQSFDRNTYLKDLDRFYVAIEKAARTMTDFSDKQHFLNTVYERFFQGYSMKLADTMGIVYTPQEIVDFMCTSVEELLRTEFGKTLASDDVFIIDPCTGTGNFIVNLIRRIPKRALDGVYRKRLFANEIMLLPYYIAALNIEHAYFEMTGTYEGFEGLCFVDTLDLAVHPQSELGFMTAKNSARVERQRAAPITVVIGNPPYNANQGSENDNNANRPYPSIDKAIKASYARDSRATLKNKLYDPYVRFIWWAIDRLGDRDGIVCFVTNNSFVVDATPFDGMRKHLEREFSAIYHVDLHGNVRRNAKLSGTIHNVFGIQTGVGVTIAIRKRGASVAQLHYHRVGEAWRKEAKLAWLSRVKHVRGVEWETLIPDVNHDWITTQHGGEFQSFVPMGRKDTKLRDAADPNARSLFVRFGPGAKSNRDDIVYDFDADSLLQRVQRMGDAYNAEVDRFKRTGAGKSVDAFVDVRGVRWSSTLKLHLERGSYMVFDPAKVRECVWRPFTKRHLYFDDILNDRLGVMRRAFPNAASEHDNVVICCTCHSQIPFVVQAANRIMNEAPGGRAGTCFPFYTYDDDGRNRTENITDWVLDQFRSHYRDSSITKWAIFYYVYGILHHPGYRSKFADNLKRELPRIPLAPKFRAFADAGRKLAVLHVDYETLKPYELDVVETKGEPLSYRVDDKMRLSKDKTTLVVNKSLALSGIPLKAFEYRLGNRSALEWVIDQYQVQTDDSTGITSDPNRPDDPEYVMRLVGQVIGVSLETVQIVGGLPANCGEVVLKTTSKPATISKQR